MSIKNYNKIVITGGVGVGKTTTINHLKNILTENKIKFVSIPEYLDASPIGADMLNNYLQGKISAFEFQEYIINYFDKYLSSIELTGDEIILFERVPDDTVTCFANIWNKQGKLSDLELFTLYQQTKALNEKYNLPSYFKESNNNDLIHMLMNTADTKKTALRIFEEIKNENYSTKQNKTIIIGLYNTPTECLERVKNRGRDEETKNYTIETIKEFNKHYTNIYNKFMNGERLRYSEIGSLV